MTRPSFLSVALAAVIVLVLGTSVYTRFERVRFRVVTVPVLADDASVSIPLPDLMPLAAAPAALVLRLRGGSESAVVRVSLDGDPVADVGLARGQEVRIDAPVRVQGTPGSRLQLTGDTAGWAVTYVEVANVYGYSRGIVSFLVVPRERTEFPRPPLLVLPMFFALLLAFHTSLDWPAGRVPRMVHRTLVGFVLLVFTTALAADLLSPYRLLLSVRTFVLFVAILYAERTLAGIRTFLRAGARATTPLIRATARLVQTAVSWRHLPAVVALVVAMALSVFAHVRGTRVAGGSDSYGYVSQSALWASGRLHDSVPIADDLPADVSDWVATPLGYVPHRSAGIRGQIVPSYPPGLPLLMASCRLVGGFESVYLVGPVLAGLTIWLTFLLGRQVHGDVVGCIAACWLATAPPFVVASLTPMSDVPTTAFWTASLVAAARPTAWSGLLAGIATLMAILTRPNLAPLAAIVAVPLVWRASTARNRRHLLGLGAFATAAGAGALGVGMLFSYWYGSPFKSGYGDFTYLFSVSQVWPNLQRYPRWMVSTGTPLVAAALVAPLLLDSRSQRRLAWLLLVFAGLVWAAYLVYIPFDTWEYLRFVLPSYPALLVLASAALVIATGRTLSPRLLTLLLLMLLMVYGVRFEGGILNVDLKTLESRYRRVGEFAARAFPERAVFLTLQHSGSLRLYGGRDILRYDLLPETSLDTVLAHLRARGYDAYFVLDKWEEEEFRKRFSAHSPLGALDWTPMAVAPGPMRVAVYDPRDRNSAQPIVTQTIP